MLKWLLLLLLLFFLFFKKYESFGWNCTYTPNKPYYKQNWILGGTVYDDRLDSYLK